MKTKTASTDLRPPGPARDVQQELQSSLLALDSLISLAPYCRGNAHYTEWLDMITGCVIALESLLQECDNFEVDPVEASCTEEIAAHDMADTALASFGSDIAAHSIAVDRWKHGQKHLWIGDRRTILELFKILLSNSVTFADSRKDQPWIKIDIRVSEYFVTLDVTDNGIGIPERHQPRIFDSFYKGSSGSPGLGLGLFILEELARHLDARVEFSSEEGHGTSFSVTFPNHLFQ